MGFYSLQCIDFPTQHRQECLGLAVPANPEVGSWPARGEKTKLTSEFVKRFYVSGSGYFTSNEARITSSMQCPLAMTSCSGPGKGQRAWIQAGVEWQPFHLALYFHKLLAFSQPNILSLLDEQNNSNLPNED